MDHPAWNAHRPQDLFQRGNDGHLYVEFIGCSDLALGHAFHFGRMQRIQHVLVLTLLRQDTASTGKRVICLGSDLVQQERANAMSSMLEL